MVFVVSLSAACLLIRSTSAVRACGSHRGSPQVDEDAALAACEAGSGCRPASKCAPCQLDESVLCKEKDSVRCGWSYTCDITASGDSVPSEVTKQMLRAS